jgi:hypothetical protein
MLTSEENTYYWSRLGALLRIKQLPQALLMEGLLENVIHASSKETLCLAFSAARSHSSAKSWYRI